MTDRDAISAEQLASIERIRQRRGAGPQRSAGLAPPALPDENVATTTFDRGTGSAGITTAAGDDGAGTRAGPPRSARTDRSRHRRHPTLRSRIAAAGLGATTMFGILTVLGRDAPATSADTPGPPDTTPLRAAPAQPVRIVIHHVPPTAAASPAADPTASPATIPVSAAPSGPIELTAEPVVRTITVEAAPVAQPRPAAPAPQPAPAATTSGSS